MEFVESKDGTRIAFERCGEGPPLVLVHGASGTHDRWHPVLPALAGRFTVYAMDRRGRGGSGDSDCYAPEREYEDVAALVDALDQPAHLLGHSFGALCALEASRLAGNLAKLVLVEPPVLCPAIPEEVTSRLERSLEAGDREGVLTAFLHEIGGIPENELEQMRNSPAWQARIRAAHTLLREAIAVDCYQFNAESFADMRASTLLILGGDSPVFYRESIELVDQALPDSRIAVLPGQQHVPMDTAPDLFVREVLGFLAE